MGSSHSQAEILSIQGVTQIFNTPKRTEARLRLERSGRPTASEKLTWHTSYARHQEPNSSCLPYASAHPTQLSAIIYHPYLSHIVSKEKVEAGSARRGSCWRCARCGSGKMKQVASIIEKLLSDRVRLSYAAQHNFISVVSLRFLPLYL